MATTKNSSQPPVDRKPHPRLTSRNFTLLTQTNRTKHREPIILQLTQDIHLQTASAELVSTPLNDGNFIKRMLVHAYTTVKDGLYHTRCFVLVGEKLLVLEIKFLLEEECHFNIFFVVAVAVVVAVDRCRFPRRLSGAFAFRTFRGRTS